MERGKRFGGIQQVIAQALPDEEASVVALIKGSGLCFSAECWRTDDGLELYCVCSPQHMLDQRTNQPVLKVVCDPVTLRHPQFLKFDQLMMFVPITDANMTGPGGAMIRQTERDFEDAVKQARGAAIGLV